jgi:hypothetical protein
MRVRPKIQTPARLVDQYRTFAPLCCRQSVTSVSGVATTTFEVQCVFEKNSAGQNMKH